MFEKTNVKEPDAHPLFAWLTTKLPGVFGKAVKWTLTKFLISRDGTPLRRSPPPVTRPDWIEGTIRAALGV
jgi:glutathione peroxidase